MNLRLTGALVALLVSPLALQSQTVTFHTNEGNIDVTLRPDKAPKTVANFLSYVNSGAYNNSVFQRSVKSFIIQGGGYQLVSGKLAQITALPPVVNEFGLSNIRGTIAMAKLDGNANSATDEWFFNLSDSNASNLDNQNGGFTVFGQVANDASLAVMDKIGAVPIFSLGAPFDTIPLINYSGSGTPADSSYVLVTSIEQPGVTPPPVSTTAITGIVSAGSFGGYTSAAPGSFIEIYGTNLAGSTRTWTASNFIGGHAPIFIDGVLVTISGEQAFVYFVSPGQVNVQVPATVPTGRSVPVVLTYAQQPSQPVSLNITKLSAGLLAPPSFLIGGKQYVEALHGGNGVPVTPTTGIPGVVGFPASRGETLLFFGLGFGPVTPNTPSFAGEVAQGQTSINTPVQFNFGTVPGTLIYAGLAPGFVGLYQFNVTVPVGSPTGEVPLQVLQGGQPIAQTLYISVK